MLEGWFRADANGTASAAAGDGSEREAGRFNISFVAEASIGTFDGDALEAALRTYLECDSPTCEVALPLEAASVRVLAMVDDESVASLAAAAELTRLSADDLETELQVRVVGAVEVHGRAVSLLMAGGLASVRCPERETCLGGDDSACLVGHRGALCGSCTEGYYRGGGGMCMLCDEETQTSVALYASTIGVVFLLTFGFIFAQFSSRRSFRGTLAEGAATSDAPAAVAARPLRRQKRKWRGWVRTVLSQLLSRSHSLGTLGKILLAYFQVLNAFRQLSSVQWPPAFAAFLDVLTPLSFQVFSVYPIGCSLSFDVSFGEQLLGVLLLPVAGATIVLLLAWLAAQCTLPKGERGLWTVAMRPETCTLQLWLLLLLYPTLAKTALTPFDCVDLGDDELLRADPSVSCKGDGWRGLAALGGLGTIVYALGFPLLCFLVTRHATRHADSADATDDKASSTGGGAGHAVARQKARGKAAAGATVSSTDDTAGGSAGGEVVATEVSREQARAKLLLRSYHESYWHWESLEVLRKYFLTSVVLVLAPDTMLQVYLGLFVCVVSALLVARHQPYADPMCGRVQLLCLTQLTFTYMSAMLFFDSGGLVSGGQLEHESTWGVALIFANILAFLLLAVGLCGAVTASVSDTSAEREEWRAQEEAMQAQIAAMRATLANPEPSSALRRAMISKDELSLGQCIGAGQFGEVFKATYHGTHVAVKTMHAHHAGAEARVANFRDEVKLLLELRHPNIIQFIGGSWDVDSGDMCLVLELAEMGSLEDLLEKTRVQLSWVWELLPIATGMARGMAYLHGQSPPIVHRDLKPANVLLSSDMTPKIADMGTALEMADGMEDRVAGSGSPLFQAPEVLRRELADGMCDVWSYGCVCFCLSTRVINPYHPTPPSVAVGEVEAFQLRPSTQFAVPSPIADVIEAASAMEYDDRISFVELVGLLEDESTRDKAAEADEVAARRVGRGRGVRTDRGATTDRPAAAALLRPQEGAVRGGSHFAGGAVPAESLERFLGSVGGTCSVPQGGGGGGTASSIWRGSTTEEDDDGEDSQVRVTSPEAKLRHSVRDESSYAAVGGTAEMSEADRRRSIKLARRKSLKAADSIRSLHGTKEGPGIEVSQRRKASLESRANRGSVASSEASSSVSSSPTAAPAVAPAAVTGPSAGSDAALPTALSLMSVPEQPSSRETDGGGGTARQNGQTTFCV